MTSSARIDGPTSAEKILAQTMRPGSNLPFNPKDCTAVPPGTCLTHGYHGGHLCPKCSSAASVDPLRMIPGHPAATTPVRARQGWTCPSCGSSYAPWFPKCTTCPKAKPATGGNA